MFDLMSIVNSVCVYANCMDVESFTFNINAAQTFQW